MKLVEVANACFNRYYPAKLPEFVYHYTNASGVHGILTSKSLWATRFEFLNDRSEYSYGQLLLRDLLQERRDEAGVELSRVWKSGYEDFPKRFPHYIASTCRDGDSVGQWRGYASLHDGYAIALSLKRLMKKPNLIVCPILYSRADQIAVLNEILDVATKEYEVSEESQRATSVSIALSVFSGALRSLKDFSFRSEEEWRLVADNETSTERFRVVGGQIVPYVEIPLVPGDIDHIIQGPGNFRLANRDAIERLASSCGFDGVTVRTSAVPIG